MIQTKNLIAVLIENVYINLFIETTKIWLFSTKN